MLYSTVNPASAAIQYSILPVPCITFNQLMLPCYPSPCLPSSSPELFPKSRSLDPPSRPFAPFNPFGFKLLRTLSLNGALATLYFSMPSALFLSQRGCTPLPPFSSSHPHSHLACPPWRACPELRGNQSETLLFCAKHEFASPLFSAHYTLFQVPYPAAPLFATLTKTTGVCTNSSHSGTPQSPVTSLVPPLPLTPAALQHTIPPARRFRRNRTSRGGAIV
jgi:hypothetical protein